MTDISADIFRADRNRRCDKAVKHLNDIRLAAPVAAPLVGRMEALIELLREDSDTPQLVNLRDVARGLDRTAVEAIQAGELVKAREAIALAITLDDRQRQLEADEFAAANPKIGMWQAGGFRG